MRKLLLFRQGAEWVAWRGWVGWAVGWLAVDTFGLPRFAGKFLVAGLFFVVLLLTYACLHSTAPLREPFQRIGSVDLVSLAID